MTKTSRRRMMLEVLEVRNLLDASSLSPIALDLAPSGHAAQGADWEQVVVAFGDGVANPRGAAELLVSRAGGSVGHIYEHALKGFSAQLPPQAVDALARNPVIAIVEPDIVMQTTSQVIPTGVTRIQAHTNAIGGTIGVGTGKQIDVGIAILDTGIASHPDLNIAGGRHFFTVTSGPPGQRGARQDNNYQDNNGHGTHVAGIAAAMDNDYGVVGVAPGARLYAVKVLGDSGFGNTSDIIAGVDWVTQNREQIQVANMSLGGTGWSTAYHTAIQNSVAAGIVYVVAAGNNWRDIHGGDGVFGNSDDTIPAAFPEVATISAFNDSEGLPGGLGPATSAAVYGAQYGLDDGWWGPSNFSNGDGANNQHFHSANPVVSPGLGIDLVLPGADIYSTWLNNGYQTLSGTNMAAPHAAGLVALHIHGYGRANHADEVHAIRQAIIDRGVSWYSNDGLVNDWSPDRHQENVGWAAGWPEPEEPQLPPTVTLESPENSAFLAGEIEIRAVAEAFGEENFLVRVDFLLDDSELGAGEFDQTSNAWLFSWDTSEYDDGIYSLTAVAVDSLNLATSHTITVTVDNIEDPPASTMDATLTGSAVEVNRNFWRAVATVEAQAAGLPLAGAVVSGQWSNGGTFSGITNANGQVMFNSSNLNRNTSSIGFNVQQIELAGYTYAGPQGITIHSTGNVTPLSTSLANVLQRDPTAESGEGEESLDVASVDRLMAALT